MDLAVGRPVYAFDASREEHRAMPAYEKPPVLLGDDYSMRNYFPQAASANSARPTPIKSA